ncbi:MAG TPA: response regulator, partial [Chondromyces sp.]|nr:response regulator [Chondromyces sp.]
EKLQMQQEELEQTNMDLEEKARILEEQNKKFERTNAEVEKARAELEVKAEQLALSSKYKSEFLANMSHELRTPLNSLLILSKLLSDNQDGNLTPKQVEYSKTIYSSGNDLLLLINDILDLAKIESGKMDVNPSNIKFTDIVDFVENNFRPIADQKNLRFNILLKEGLPHFLYSDEVRLQQVLKNLLSNAFKFTNQGGVTLEISAYKQLSNRTIIAFSVIDTGIGISKEKQAFIFEAFQQADGTTSRKYGGTGLGLSISKEIAALLGGEIVVESTEGIGSTFTFYLGDYEHKENESHVTAENEVAVSIEKTEPVLEDSESLPLKNEKPATESSHIKKLLIVDDDTRQRNSLMELIGDMDIVIKAVSTGRDAIEELKVNRFDCMILDLGLSDTSGFELLEAIKENDEYDEVKVFVYTGRDLTLKEEIQLSKYAHTIIIKNEHSPQRLKAELELYLKEHSNWIELYEGSSYEEVNQVSGLSGKKVLLVDDDVRNVFALSSILELNGMEVLFAENGFESINMLQENHDIDLVLMDIMMPEMNGYEAIEKIRENPQFHNLPIIALTAKAMKEDREKCLAVGASDYIVKPIEPEQLISLIKVWLYQ